MVMGSAYAEMGMYYEAIEMHKKGLSISPDYESSLGVAYARAGQKDKALEVAAGIGKKYGCMVIMQLELAEIYAALGEKEKATECP